MTVLSHVLFRRREPRRQSNGRSCSEDCRDSSTKCCKNSSNWVRRGGQGEGVEVRRGEVSVRLREWEEEEGNW